MKWKAAGKAITFLYRIFFSHPWFFYTGKSEWLLRGYSIITAVTRRTFLKLFATSATTYALVRRSPANAQASWQTLLLIYTDAARGNIVTVNGRRALLSSRLYPGTYVRDALFWGPLALDDPELGYECYRWFAETQRESGQIRTAVPLHPDEAAALEAKDDEGTLLFIIASDWLRTRGYVVSRLPALSAATPHVDLTLSAERIERAYAWVMTHVTDHRYVSPVGAFRYWADTVSPNHAETIAHNQGLLCLARRAMVNLGLGGVTEDDIAAAQAALRSLYDTRAGYLPLGVYSNFARAQDISAVFPEWLSRYLYGERLLSDEMVVSHAQHILRNALVADDTGRLAGIKVISGEDGRFLPQRWFYAAGLNPPGDYQNGGYWPMYTHIMLALAYAITSDTIYARLAATLVHYELGQDQRTKEIIRLSPGKVGTFLAARVDYTWNALIPVALRWAGIAP